MYLEYIRLNNSLNKLTAERTSFTKCCAVLIVSTFILSSCAAPKAPDFEGKSWGRVNAFTDKIEVISQDVPYVYEALNLDATLSSMLERWAVDSQFGFKNSCHSDFSLPKSIRKIKGRTLAAGAKQVNELYVNQYISVSVKPDGFLHFDCQPLEPNLTIKNSEGDSMSAVEPTAFTSPWRSFVNWFTNSPSVQVETKSTNSIDRSVYLQPVSAPSESKIKLQIEPASVKTIKPTAKDAKDTKADKDAVVAAAAPFIVSMLPTLLQAKPLGEGGYQSVSLTSQASAKGFDALNTVPLVIISANDAETIKPVGAASVKEGPPSTTPEFQSVTETNSTTPLLKLKPAMMLQMLTQ
jgi:hypothetical protein